MAEEEIATADWEEEALDAAWESLFPGSTAEPTVGVSDETKSRLLGGTWNLVTFSIVDGGHPAKSVVNSTIRGPGAGEFLGLWPDAGMWDQRLPDDDWSRRLDLMADILGGLTGDQAAIALKRVPQSLGEGITGAWSSQKDYEPCRDEAGRFAPCGGGSAVTDSERGQRLDSARKLINQMKAAPPTTEQTKQLTEHLSKLTGKQLAGLKREHGLKTSAQSKPALVAALDAHLGSQRAEAFHQAGLEAAARSIDKAGVGEAVRSGKPLSPEDLEKVSDVVHQEWMARERARDGGVRPDREKLMVPYKDLPEPEKEKDRVYALEAVAAQRPADHWGSKEAGGQPFYRPGPNPTVDAVITRDGKDEKELLMIRRGADSPTEGGKWALPGGFHETDAKKGEPWKPGKETSSEAAARELKEETGLDLKQDLHQVGIYDKRGRDPRDNAEAWSSSTAFAAHVGAGTDTSKVIGKDDADRAEWVPVSKIGERQIAFDHAKIIEDALRPSGKDTKDFEPAELGDAADVMADILGGLCGDAALTVFMTPDKAFCPGAGAADNSCPPANAGGAKPTDAQRRQAVNREVANMTIQEIKDKGVTADRIKELTRGLQKLTLPDLKALRLEHGLKANPKLKAALVAALTEHLKDQPAAKLKGTEVPGATIAEKVSNYKEADNAITKLAPRHEEEAKLIQTLRETKAELLAANERWVRLPFASPDHGKMADVEKAAREKWNAAKEAYTTHTGESRKILTDMLKAEKPTPIPLLSKNGNATSFKPAKDAGAFVASLLQLKPEEKLPNVEVKVGGKQRSAMQVAINRSTGETRTSILVAGQRDPGSIVHEIGHAVESNVPRILSASQEFIAHRFGDEKPVSMAMMFPGYGLRPNDLGRKDGFDKLFDGAPGKPDPTAYYVGKEYKGTNGGPDATEIVSVGLESLYNNPAKMAAKDPEYFRFLVGVMTGAVGPTRGPKV